MDKARKIATKLSELLMEIQPLLCAAELPAASVLENYRRATVSFYDALPKPPPESEQAASKVDESKTSKKVMKGKGTGQNRRKKERMEALLAANGELGSDLELDREERDEAEAFQPTLTNTLDDMFDYLLKDGSHKPSSAPPSDQSKYLNPMEKILILRYREVVGARLNEKGQPSYLKCPAGLMTQWSDALAAIFAKPWILPQSGVYWYPKCSKWDVKPHITSKLIYMQIAMIDETFGNQGSEGVKKMKEMTEPGYWLGVVTFFDWIQSGDKDKGIPKSFDRSMSAREKEEATLVADMLLASQEYKDALNAVDVEEELDVEVGGDKENDSEDDIATIVPGDSASRVGHRRSGRDLVSDDDGSEEDSDDGDEDIEYESSEENAGRESSDGWASEYKAGEVDERSTVFEWPEFKSVGEVVVEGVAEEAVEGLVEGNAAQAPKFIQGLQNPGLISTNTVLQMIGLGSS
ncbi:uncharacterized protein PAC_19050 [Phialocephala subalpina]|uniref:Uncharacterized protein n=1 Tax=Phialocephala subalpina TaxID=576137 RepID=A0A1L7XVX2_9HELO|nr:uncharacterized protein PAC_19050 [Phialocephala subalpina]